MNIIAKQVGLTRVIALGSSNSSRASLRGQRRRDSKIEPVTPARKLLTLALMMCLSNGVLAQSVTGGLYGHESNAKADIEVTRQATGFEKILHVDYRGRYHLSGLNPGNYKVSLVRDGRSIGNYTVEVKPNQDSAVPDFPNDTAAKAPTTVAAKDLNTIQVSASRAAGQINPIDVSTPELSTTYSSTLIDQLPVDRSPESVATLNSNVQRDSANTGYVSIGGASSAENRYYYNEFDVTNDKTSVGSTTLPAEAISNTQVISGGSTASWTNATGGILSSTIKQGTNEFKAGYSLYFTPPTSLLLNPRNHNSLNSLGDYYSYAGANNHDSSATQYLWASGALVKDKLFFYVLLGNQPPSKSHAYGETLAEDTSSRDKNALINVTWNITNNQSLNILGHKDWDDSFNNYYSLTRNYDPTSRGDYYSWDSTSTNSRFLIGNYHWQINDNLALRLMGGYLGSVVSSDASAYTDSANPYVTSVDPITQMQTNIGKNNNPYVYSPSDYFRRGFKGDLTWNIGDHKLVFGGEYYKYGLASTTDSTPGGWYTYFDQAVTLNNGAATNGKYVSQYVDNEGGSFQSINKGAYVEDYWQVADKVMLYGALRYDLYVDKDGVGSNFLRLPMTSPRLGFAWDVNGDSSLKVGGSVGKYSIPLPSSFSFGVAEDRVTYNNYYTYTGVSPTTSAPTGLQQIGNTYYYNNGVAPANQISASNIKAPYQYEAQLYVQKQITPSWSALAEVSWVDLRRVIEDTCYGGYNSDTGQVTGGVTAYAQSHGYPGYTESDGNCWLVNPGQAMTLTRDYNGDGQLESLTIPASAMGLPEPEHKYSHLTLGLTHASTPAEPYFLNVSYTFAREFGNTDGLLDEERRDGGYIGQTPNFNYPGIMDGSNGNLFGDIRHTLTTTGTYTFRDRFTVGGVLTAHTGAPTSCFGTYPDANNPDYRETNQSHYCDNELAKQGTAGRLPFFWQLDLSGSYHWKINQKNDLTLQVIVSNVTNRKGVINVDQTYDTGSLSPEGTTTLSPDYLAQSYQAPRATSFVLRYQF